MGIKTKQILAVLIGVLPLYIINIYANVTDNIAYLPEVVLLKYPAFVALVLLIVFLLNKFLLKKELSVFNQYKSTFLYDIAIAFLFLITYYFLLSLSQISYTRWLNENVDQTAVFDLARNIYANWFYTSLLFGPFVLLTQSAWVISSAFTLNNLWDLTNSKTGHWIIIVLLAAVISFVNYHNGIQGVIFWFTINLAANIFYYNYRRATPLLIAFFIINGLTLLVFGFI